MLMLVVTLLAGWRKLTGSLVVLLLALTFYPLGNLLLQPLEQRFAQPELPDQVAGIIVLGGAEDPELSAIWQQPQFNMAAERDMSILPLIRKYQDVPVVLTGGSGSVRKPEYRGADVLQQWLAAQGLEEQVIYERNSRNTFENAIYTQESVPQGSDIADSRGWLLVTSAFHIPRSVGIFEKQGWNVIPYPVDYYSKPLTLDNWRADLGRNLFELGIGTREWIGLTAYFLTDKTNTLFPGSE